MLKEFFKNIFRSKYECIDKNCQWAEIKQTVSDMQADGWRLIDTIGFENGVYNLLFERKRTEVVSVNESACV